MIDAEPTKNVVSKRDITTLNALLEEVKQMCNPGKKFNIIVYDGEYREVGRRSFRRSFEDCSIEELELRVSSDYGDYIAHKAKDELERRYSLEARSCSMNELFEKLKTCTVRQRFCIMKALREDHHVFSISYIGEKPTSGEIAYSVLEESHFYPHLDEHGNAVLGYNDLHRSRIPEGAYKYFHDHLEEMLPVLLERDEFYKKYDAACKKGEYLSLPWKLAYCRLDKAPW